ncbi:hypothetical protein [Bacillus sp. FJAT-49736]|uniref:hypothetical protein n=1 Tax=Bacillus sp. FJAT-49736 TaxID=2833582 RepID=UPI001BCA1A25|nr:hypothetical protein [Bacillus sp. FJAT-49736]MBS4174340.1 hypothetical protein [Bacillus sp. FJAT-49736]
MNSRKQGFGMMFLLTLSLILYQMVISNGKTYALFSNSFQEEIQVSAASAEDTIKDVEINEQPNDELEIEIEKSDSNGYQPEISIDVEGELGKYIEPIDPITVSESASYPLEMLPMVGAKQDLMQLKSSGEKTLSGSLVVRNFNGKKITSKKMKISVDSLLSKMNKESEDSEKEGN